MANRIVSVHAGIYGMGIYAIMLQSSGFSVAHCFGRIVSITLPGKILNESEKLPPIVGPSLTCQTTTDHLQLLFSPDASSPTGLIFHLILHPTL